MKSMLLEIVWNTLHTLAVRPEYGQSAQPQHEDNSLIKKKVLTDSKKNCNHSVLL
jgi:hypothetical protein